MPKNNFFFIFFSLILSTLIFWDSFSSWALLIFAVASTKTPCVRNTSSHVITEIINHRNKKTDYFFWSQKPQVQLCLLWSILSPGIIKGFPVIDRLHPSIQWFLSPQCFDLIFYSQVILFNLLQTFFHTRFRVVILPGKVLKCSQRHKWRKTQLLVDIKGTSHFLTSLPQTKSTAIALWLFMVGVSLSHATETTVTSWWN